VSDEQRLTRNAARYEWLREQVKNKDARVLAQALFWNNESRTEFDRAVDRGMQGATKRVPEDGAAGSTQKDMP